MVMASFCIDFLLFFMLSGPKEFTQVFYSLQNWRVSLNRIIFLFIVLSVLPII